MVEELIVPDADAWWLWLAEHHALSNGVLLVLARKGTTQPTQLTYDEALEASLCHGWIDGQVQRRDQATFRQRFTRRRARSIWSKRNVGIAERLVAEGRMQPAGAAEMERARRDGRWEAAYDGPRTIAVPDDLAAALEATAPARATFEKLNSQNRYAILLRLSTARQAETRARRLEAFMAMLARGETIYPQKL